MPSQKELDKGKKMEDNRVKGESWKVKFKYSNNLHEVNADTAYEAVQKLGRSLSEVDEIWQKKDI